MENNIKVFSSDITRVGSTHKNNLYDLLNIIPATPLKLKETKVLSCDYSPKTGKIYIPKKKTRLKVKTVREIRKSFEQDIYCHLISDLETQQNILFKKIRRGSSRDDKTKKLATKFLRGETPISRSTWQMLINLNPEHQKHPRQFVLWNGKYIQVNGSYGGMKKNICHYDLASKPHSLSSQNHKKKCLKQYEGNRKKKLLRNSLAINFKPGPLCQKQFLDNSHQKYNVGNIELINLPRPGLDVQPTYGTAFETSIINFLNNLRKEDVTISRKWAELSVSVLGRVEKFKAVQQNRDCVTFDLAYKYNQNRLLMRRDKDHCCNTSEIIYADTSLPTVEINVQLEIEVMVNKMIDAVEMHLIQDDIFTQEQELKTYPREDLNSVNTVTPVKDKSKRKFGELDRLDVTVITLPETEESNLSKSCIKNHCSLGCICASLEGSYNLKQHCGRVECMFDCKCDFTKYKNNLFDTGCADVLPGVLSINNEINFNLAKEEQKFHQTVIVTGEKRILLKGERRHWKTSKKYADFYTNMSLNHENQKTQNVSIVALKLNCDNIEPWCMVHKLYKCFCKGKFTETCVSDLNETVGKEPLSIDSISNDDCLENKKLTNDDNSIEDCGRRERINLVKKSKTSDNSHIKPNKKQTSISMDKTTNTKNITEHRNYDDPENDIHINRILNKYADPVFKASVVEKINLNSEKGMLTRHAVKRLNSDDKNHENKSDSEGSDYLKYWDSESMSSSRTSAYEGRKYSNGYYKNTNNKIITMEKNDKRLQDRLAFLYSKCCEEDTSIKPTRTPNNDTARLLKLLCDSNKYGEDSTSKAKRRRLSNDTSLVTWLESHYKIYKQQNDSGLFKNALEPPQLGKIALHTWDFILKRYRERKNLFLVSRHPPFRIFMAVNTDNPFFENCIDINDIRFADLHKFPATVKNLLINATELKENFCILRGLACCWELFGTVAKVKERNELAEHEDTPEISMDASDIDTLGAFNENISPVRKSVVENTEQNNKDTLDACIQDSSEANDIFFENTEQTETLSVFNHSLEIKDSLLESKEQKDLDKIDECNKKKPLQQKNIKNITGIELENKITECSDDTGSSKWFVMTIENDFSEIRFFRKGFFVKYGSIINAINVARLSGKTVRLSSKKCIEQPEAPQFGIYAIPNDNEYCVFVGPYEMEDTLGIETIKTILDVRRLKRTRGFWITTNKIDNLKVVENPLSFMPLSNCRINNALIPLETNFCVNGEINKGQQDMSAMQESFSINKMNESQECSPSKKGQIKIVKPIKIRKTNGFYHLASDGLLKKISLQYPQNTPKPMPVILKPCLNMEENSAESSLTSVHMNLNLNSLPETSQQPIAEASSSAASLIKISAVFSTQNNDPIAKRTNPERGMFILKPEEINRKLAQNKLTDRTLSLTDEYNIDDSTTNLNLLQSGLENVTTEEHQLVDAEGCALNDDIYVISDDEHDTKASGTTVNNIWADVWIECTNIPNLGWIAAIKNVDNLLSFKIPGCEYSEFYPEEEAFSKISLEIRKRVNSLNDLQLQWKVYESIDQLQGQEMNPEHLYPDYILTPEGLLHTSEIIKSSKDNLKTYSKKQMNGNSRGTNSPREISKAEDEKNESQDQQ